MQKSYTMRAELIVDSSVLIKTLLENEKGLILSLLENYELFPPANVLEETAYKTIVLTVSDLIKNVFLHCLHELRYEFLHRFCVIHHGFWW